MITTSDAAHADRLRRVVAFGLKRASEQPDTRWHYEVVERGFKYNLSDLLAALGIAQLQKAAVHARRRAEVVHHYTDQLSGLDGIELPPTHQSSGHAWHLYIIRLNLEKLALRRDEFIQLRAAWERASTSAQSRCIPGSRTMGQWNGGPKRSESFPGSSRCRSTPA